MASLTAVCSRGCGMSEIGGVQTVRFRTCRCEKRLFFLHLTTFYSLTRMVEVQRRLVAWSADSF